VFLEEKMLKVAAGCHGLSLHTKTMMIYVSGVLSVFLTKAKTSLWLSGLLSDTEASCYV
jgi:hypothetical protein